MTPPTTTTGYGYDVAAPYLHGKHAASGHARWIYDGTVRFSCSYDGRIRQHFQITGKERDPDEAVAIKPDG